MTTSACVQSGMARDPAFQSSNVRRTVSRRASLMGPSARAANAYVGRLGCGELFCRLLLGGIRLVRVGGGGADERAEERLGPVRPRVELGVELGGDEERVIGQLDDLDQPLVRRGAAAHEPLV